MIKNLIYLNKIKFSRYFSDFVKLNKNNYFDIFNCKNEFTINEEQLAKQFKSMQMIYHPDKTAKLDEESKIIADYNSSLINHAYQTLKDPFKRGKHLLNLNNLSIEEDESTKNLNNEFLIKLMEINEQINENRKSSIKLRQLLNELNDEKLNLLKLIDNCFKDKNYLKAKNYLIEFNFYENAIKKIIELID